MAAREPVCASPHEQPVLLADGAGADRVLDQVVVDLHATITQEDAQLRPLIEGIADGLSGEAAREVFRSNYGDMDAEDGIRARGRSRCNPCP